MVCAGFQFPGPWWAIGVRKETGRRNLPDRPGGKLYLAGDGIVDGVQVGVSARLGNWVAVGRLDLSQL